MTTSIVRPHSALLLIALVMTLTTNPAQAQGTTAPPLPRGYAAAHNAVQASGNGYTFTYAPAGQPVLAYTYALDQGGTLGALKVTAGGAFVPSNAGGPSAAIGGKERMPWDGDVTYQLVDHALAGGTVTARWAMTAGNERMVYVYRMSMKGRTLRIDITWEDGAPATGVYLDRSEGARAAFALPVPYLTLASILLADGQFCSMYFDWEGSSASEIFPVTGRYSAGSARFAQYVTYRPLTDGRRNTLRETVFLTVSGAIEDVLPSIPNPVSRYKAESGRRIVWDYWHRVDAKGRITNDFEAVRKAGCTSIWMLAHDWQPRGYDNAYPTIFSQDGAHENDGVIRSLGGRAKAAGYLLGLHENYVDLHENSSEYSPARAAKAAGGEPARLFGPVWNDAQFPQGHQVYLLKPGESRSTASSVAAEIRRRYGTTTTFLDVHPSANPSKFVDYASGAEGAGTFRATMSAYRGLFGDMQRIYQGPVSGEGRHHFLYLGYIDDVEAQINTADDEVFGVRAPLLVDFDLRRLHDKAAVHGVGYYQRFYGNAHEDQNWTPFSKDSILIYMATELAFGHGGFVPDGRMSALAIEDHAALEEKYILPVQRGYGGASVKSIQYSNGSRLLTASDYLRQHPEEYRNPRSPGFMGQVRVEYSNGVIVYVNRHPNRPWGNITLPSAGGTVSVNSTAGLHAGAPTGGALTLPPRNGWACFVPAR